MEYILPLTSCILHFSPPSLFPEEGGSQSSQNTVLLGDLLYETNI